MKANALHSFAALVAGSLVAIASAQDSPAQPNAAPQGQNLSNANIATTKPDVTSSAARGEAAPAMSFVNEPVASAIKTDGEGADKMNAIVQALNAEPSLKNSKITVQMDKDVVLLTGAAMSQDQVKRATELARSSADNAMVVNTIQPDHIAYQMPGEKQAPVANPTTAENQPPAENATPAENAPPAEDKTTAESENPPPAKT